MLYLEVGVDGMRYWIISKTDEISNDVSRRVKELAMGVLDEKNPEVVFSIGGDGTVLDVIERYQSVINQILIVSIHTGNLGFYTEFLPNELDEMFKLLKEEKSYVNYYLLEYEVNDIKGYALNEITMSGIGRMLKAEVYIDHTYLMHTRGNGICVSTPTGSTAYNKALGGAILDNKLKAIQLNLIAPFETAGNKVIYPVVLSEAHEFVIKPDDKHIDLSFDRRFISLENVTSIKVRLSQVCVKFLKNEKHDFAHRIHKTFIARN